MRPEKKYLVEEVGTHLDKSDYVFLADYTGITVAETAQLRASLATEEAEFHVVKNTVLNVAARERELPSLSSPIDGPTAIIVGGRNPSEVAKIVLKFVKDKDKVRPKGGILSGSVLSADDVEALSKLPSLEVLKAQLLGLLNTPAQQLVRVINAVPQNVLNVLDAKRRKDEEAA